MDFLKKLSYEIDETLEIHIKDKLNQFLSENICMTFPK